MGRVELREGDYLASLVTRKDGSTFIAYFRVLKALDPVDHVAVFVDDTGARVKMSPELICGMRELYRGETYPIIDLEPWREQDEKD